MSASPGDGRRKELFTGANLHSRAFEVLVMAAAVILGGAAVTRLPDSAWPAHSVSVSVLTALAGCAAIVGGGLSVLAAGQKTFLNFGGSAALAAVLALPARYAFPASFTGILISQLIRRARGDRLSIQTIVFNQAQRVAGWAVADLVYVRVRTDLRTAALDAWVPILAAAATYWLFNTWTVASWNALRRRGSAWELWSRKVQEMGPAYMIEFSAVVVAARASAAYPVAAMAMLWAAGVAYLMVLRGIGVLHDRQVAALQAGLREQKRRPASPVERSERAAWASMGIPIDADDGDDRPPAGPARSSPSGTQQDHILR